MFMIYLGVKSFQSYHFQVTTIFSFPIQQVIGSGSPKTSDGKKKSSNTINKRQNLKSLGQLAVMSAEELRSFPVQRYIRYFRFRLL